MSPTYVPRQIIPGTVYRVVRELGAGGMGRVYEVEDITVGRTYALKTLHGEFGQDRDSLQRLVLESRALGRLQHPNIVEVITAGVTQDRAIYYVMELLRGASLRAVLERKGTLEPSRAVRVGLSVATAVQQAHAHGVVHRDIKPDNIFLSMRPEGSTAVKVVDFGVVALLQNAKRTEKEVGMMIGTPGYSSPEQLRGERAAESMDIWSLGAVFFEMLAGRPLFPVPMADAIAAILGEDVAPDVRTESPAVPKRLARLVASMLEKDPRRRVATIAMVVAELRAV